MMTAYGFDQTENHVWKVLIDHILYTYGKKEGMSVLETDGIRTLLREDIVFGSTGLLMKKNSICRSIIPDEKNWKAYLELLVSMEKEYLEEENQMFPEVGIYYYLVELDQRTEDGQKKLLQIKECLEELAGPDYEVNLWDISQVEDILNISMDILGSYVSFLADREEGRNLFGDGSQAVWAQLNRYLEKCFMEDQFSKMEQAGSVTDEKVALAKVFVDLEAANEDQRDTAGMFVEEVIQQANCPNRFEKNFYKEERLRRVARKDYVLLGTAGQGKSTICQYLMQIYRAVWLEICSGLSPRREIHQFYEIYKKQQSMPICCFRIPIHIVIKEYAAWMQKQLDQEEPADVFLYIQMQMKRKAAVQMEGEKLRELFRILSWIFVFDGLDEVPSSSNRQRLVQEINEFISGDLRRENSDSLVICTSRPQANLEGFNKENFCYLRLKELSETRCMAYLKRLVDQLGNSRSEREQFLSVLKESVHDPIVSRLMKTPLQATIVAILVKTGGKPPKDRYNLFDTYYQTMKNREKQKETLETLHDTFEWMDNIHYSLALQLQRESESDRNPSASITGKRFRSLIREYLNQVDDSAELEMLCESFFHILTERLCFITDVNTEGEYMFSIRSMQEFLAARGIVQQRESRMLEELKRIAPSAYWRNVFLFALGYLNKYIPDMETEVHQICEKLNGSDCTPAQCSLEKVCYAGSWLALDILIEGIYKGSVKKEKTYFDLFFQLKDHPPVGKLRDCGYLAPEKKDYLKREYILPLLKKEKTNLVLWFMLGMAVPAEEVLEHMKELSFTAAEQGIVFNFLNDKFVFWEGELEKKTACYVADYLQKQDADMILSYDECAALLLFGNLEDKPSAKRIVCRNILLHGKNFYRSHHARHKAMLEYLPEFWGGMENILERLGKKKKDLEIAEVIRFRLKYSILAEKEREIFEQAEKWFDQKQLDTEAAFLRLVLYPDQGHVKEYFECLGKERFSIRMRWLEVHMEQSHVIHWMTRECNLRELLVRKPEEIADSFTFDYEEAYQSLKAAIDHRDWKKFWKNVDLMGANASGSVYGICHYMEEFGRNKNDIPDMSDNEIAYLLFVIAVNLEDHELEEEEILILKSAYSEYVSRTWRKNWVNIWARKIALYLLEQKDKTELLACTDSYQAFLPTESNPYYYKEKSVLNKDMQRLWDNVLWMLEAVQTDHPVFRILPALLLSSPQVERRYSDGKYRALLEKPCKHELEELGRLLFLFLVPDWCQEEIEQLSIQIFAFLDKVEPDICGLFLKLGERYDGKRSKMDIIWLKMYEYLISNSSGQRNVWDSYVMRVCELAYKKVTEGER